MKTKDAYQKYFVLYNGMCISEGIRETTDRIGTFIYEEREILILRNCLMGLWRLTSPMCPGGPGRVAVTCEQEADGYPSPSGEVFFN